MRRIYRSLFAIHPHLSAFICGDMPRVVKRWNTPLVLARRGFGAQGHAL
ncbi:MAG: hypothetical protein HYU76_03600 [Betaproteobacteria bacterium]|nr:hypothetical protein [Betaproteobacteria bacterium]